MAFIGPWEIALILVVVLILFGPKKLPDLAKGVGKAIREYKKATNGLEELAEEPITSLSKSMEDTDQSPTKSNSEATSAVSSSTSSSKSAEETLISTAKQLKIPTEGKSIEEIAKEIVKQSPPTSSVTTTTPIKS
jgi:sec-independent protein translocase protein TatA